MNRLELPRHLLGRVYLFAIVLLVEYAAIVSVPHPWCKIHRVIAGAIVFLAVFLFTVRRCLQDDRNPLQLNRLLLALYPVCLAVIAAAHLILLKTTWGGRTAVIVWFVTIPLSAIILLCALIPARELPSVLCRTRIAWAYAISAALLASALSGPVLTIWNAPTNWPAVLIQRTTFHWVGGVLQIYYPNVIVDAASYSITLPNFAGTIAGSCSGIEGLSLILLFTLGWLWYARRELRFPHALLLLPCALALIYALNILRIVTLLIIGNSGYQGVARNGFHSEAGWITFNVVSLAILTVASRLPWITRRNSIPPTAVSERNAAAIYLLPFLAILAAAFLSRAASSGFEWLYPLRFLAAAAVLWHYRAEYRRIPWRFTWKAPTIGALVFLMWLALSRWTASSPSNSTGAALATMPAIERFAWLAVRVIAAVVTVPIAEELAFRGFLLRRIVSADIEAVAYGAVTPLALLLSSVAFGLMHGKLWLAGIVAGLAYGLLAKHTGRLAEAIAAHATTNLLLAIWVLARGDWGLW